MASEDLWRYAEPDGKQRSLSLDDLRDALARGLLPTNVPVWKRGFADWIAATEVAELRSSVATGARLLPPKGHPMPGRPVAQKGGAAATEEEPLSPPSYFPAPKARPSAPALSLKGKEGGDTPSGRARAATLLIAGGAPAGAADDDEAAPIKVPNPSGSSAEAPNTITRPPPVDRGAAEVLPSFPSAETSTVEVPAAVALANAEASADDNWDIPTGVSTRPPLARRSGVDQDAETLELQAIPAVTSSMFLPELDDSTRNLPALDDSAAEMLGTSELIAIDADDAPASTQEIAEADLISERRPPTLSHPPPLAASKRPPSLSQPAASRSSAPPASSLPKATPPPPAREASERIGLNSRPPPPSIDPLASEPPPPLPPPPALPEEAKREIPTVPPSRPVERTSESRGGVPPWMFVAGLAVAAGGTYLATRGGGESEQPAPSTPAVASSAPVVAAPSASAKADAQAAAGKVHAVVCGAAGSSRVIQSDVGIQAVRSGLALSLDGKRVALGFAKSAREATALELDPLSLAPTTTASSKASAELRRVLPRFDGAQLVAVGESDAEVDGLSTRRSAGSLTLGIAGGKLVLEHDGNKRELFALPSTAVDALRVGPVAGSDKDVVYTYREPGAVWYGATSEGFAPQRAPGLGETVGSPVVVSLDTKHVLAAWADRASEQDEWALRISSYTPGGAPRTRHFTPEGSGKGSAFAPALVRVNEQRALLLWSEDVTRDNGESTHAVRGQTLDAQGTPVGNAFTVSARDMDAAQAQATLGEAGTGVAAFLVQREDGIDLAAAAIRCE